LGSDPVTRFCTAPAVVLKVAATAAPTAEVRRVLRCMIFILH
jgi:hypothetical protein